jgi:hypothetical protein
VQGAAGAFAYALERRALSMHALLAVEHVL